MKDLREELLEGLNIAPEETDSEPVIYEDPPEYDFGTMNNWYTDAEEPDWKQYSDNAKCVGCKSIEGGYPYGFWASNARKAMLDGEDSEYQDPIEDIAKRLYSKYHPKNKAGGAMPNKVFVPGYKFDDQFPVRFIPLLDGYVNDSPDSQYIPFIYVGDEQEEFDKALSIVVDEGGDHIRSQWARQDIMDAITHDEVISLRSIDPDDMNDYGISQTKDPFAEQDEPIELAENIKNKKFVHDTQYREEIVEAFLDNPTLDPAEMRKTLDRIPDKNADIFRKEVFYNLLDDARRRAELTPLDTASSLHFDISNLGAEWSGAIFGNEVLDSIYELLPVPRVFPNHKANSRKSESKYFVEEAMNNATDIGRAINNFVDRTRWHFGTRGNSRIDKLDLLFAMMGKEMTYEYLLEPGTLEYLIQNTTGHYKKTLKNWIVNHRRTLAKEFNNA